MDRVPIILSLRVSDGMDDTERLNVEAFVIEGGFIVDGDGQSIDNTESEREGNRREIKRGRLQVKLNVLNEKIFALDSGVSMPNSSPFIRVFVRELLFIRVRKLERGISAITKRKSVTA